MSAVTIERPARVATVNRKKVRESLTTTVQLSRQIMRSLYRKDVVISLALVAVLVISSVGVVVSGQQNRELFNTLSQLHAERDGYQREWSQLLLEQSALSAHSRIERRASEQLGMVVPGRESIVLVPAERLATYAH